MNYRLVLLLVALLTSRLADETPAQQSAEGTRFAVTSGHPEATQIGMEILRNGGNAIDAAIATSLALGVAEPYGSGLGGKLILLYRDAASGETTSIVALCRAPHRLQADEFTELPSRARKTGYHAIGVPGLPAGLAAAHKRWGSVAWRDLVRPARELADRGVTIDAKMQSLYRPKVPLLQQDPEASRLYLVAGELPPIGATLRNPDLGETLGRLAAQGIEDFYRGETARRLVSAAQAQGSPLRLEDLASYEVDSRQPLSIRYRGFDVWSCPPPLTGGITVLLALRMLEAETFADLSAHRSDHIHAVSRTLLAIYPRVSAQIGDVAAAHQQAAVLLQDPQIAEMRKEASQADPADPYRRAGVDGDDADASVSASTSHLCVIDEAGNMVSLTQSLSHHFGAAVIAPGTGFLLNNSMNNFSTHSPQHVNFVQGGKVARSTIAPILVARDGKPLLSLGIPGGQRIPTTTIQLLNDILDFRLALDESFDQPRFHLRRPIGARSPANLIDLEAGLPEGVATALTRRGWRTRSQQRNGGYFGGGSAIVREEDGNLIAVGDTRRTNHAAAE